LLGRIVHQNINVSKSVKVLGQNLLEGLLVPQVGRNQFDDSFGGVLDMPGQVLGAEMPV
jgi:hypothetical protein